jgi:hypothetical protein
VNAFRLSHTLHIVKQFSKSSGTSNKLLSFWMLILLEVVLTERALLVPTFFSDPLVCYSSWKQSSIAQSTTEAEYVPGASCCSQILWIVYTMRDFGVIFERVPLMCDNTTAISIGKTPVFYKRMKHLKVRYHFLRDHVEKGDIKRRYIDTDR